MNNFTNVSAMTHGRFYRAVIGYRASLSRDKVATATAPKSRATRHDTRTILYGDHIARFYRPCVMALSERVKHGEALAENML